MSRPTSDFPVERAGRLDLRVRYAETDAMGYLHHSNYLVYFEMGRTELLRLCGVSYREMEERGFFYVVAKIEVRYRVPARYDDEVTLYTWTEKLSPVRIDHRYRLQRGAELLTDASSTLVCVSREGRPVAAPDDVYDAMVRVAGAAENQL
ncbi:MAG: thioesterase family protein [Phycisphaerae bacterium]|nr:thioesterase family protein [Phycisphaerae bacterium]